MKYIKNFKYYIYISIDVNQNKARKHHKNNIRESTIEMELFCYNLFFFCHRLYKNCNWNGNKTNYEYIKCESTWKIFVIIFLYFHSVFIFVSNKLIFTSNELLRTELTSGCSVKLVTFIDKWKPFKVHSRLKCQENMCVSGSLLATAPSERAISSYIQLLPILINKNWLYFLRENLSTLKCFER